MTVLFISTVPYPQLAAPIRISILPSGFPVTDENSPDSSNSAPDAAQMIPKYARQFGFTVYKAACQYSPDGHGITENGCTAGREHSDTEYDHHIPDQHVRYGQFYQRPKPAGRNGQGFVFCPGKKYRTGSAPVMPSARKVIGEKQATPNFMIGQFSPQQTVRNMRRNHSFLDKRDIAGR